MKRTSQTEAASGCWLRADRQSSTSLCLFIVPYCNNSVSSGKRSMGGQIHLEVSGWHAECGGMGNGEWGMRHAAYVSQHETSNRCQADSLCNYYLCAPSRCRSDPISNPNFNLNLNSTQPSTNGSPAQHGPAPVNLKSNVTQLSTLKEINQELHW